MSNHAKDLRKQLRNVVQELGPDLAKQEIFEQAFNLVRSELKQRMNEIENLVRYQLKVIDDRNKDAQSYLLRLIAQEEGKVAPTVDTAPTESTTLGLNEDA